MLLGVRGHTHAAATFTRSVEDSRVRNESIYLWTDPSRVSGDEVVVCRADGKTAAADSTGRVVTRAFLNSSVGPFFNVRLPDTLPVRPSSIPLHGGRARVVVVAVDENGHV